MGRESYNNSFKNKQDFDDGKLKILEDYYEDELFHITLVDSRDRIIKKVHSDRIVSISFIFIDKEDRLELSRIFADSKNGSHALDTKPSYFKDDGFRKTLKRRDLLDSDSLDFLSSEYPQKTIDRRRIRDKIRSKFPF